MSVALCTVPYIMPASACISDISTKLKYSLYVPNIPLAKFKMLLEFVCSNIILILCLHIQFGAVS